MYIYFEILVFIAYIHLSVSYNISWLLLDSSEKRQTSDEKIKNLLNKEVKNEKTGYNAAKIKLSNEVILQLMDKGCKKAHGDEMLKLISEYTVGMNENTLDIVLHHDLKNMWAVYEEILRFGKPSFIEHECDIHSMRARFGWKDGPVDYFNYIRKDARKAWDYFVKEFTKIKDIMSTHVSPMYFDS